METTTDIIKENKTVPEEAKEKKIVKIKEGPKTIPQKPEKRVMTIDLIKKKRTVPQEVHEKRKEFVRMKKLIINSLKEGPKTIPQIAKETSVPDIEITYYLMTLRKFREVITGELDDNDEYFTYELNNNK